MIRSFVFSAFLFFLVFISSCGDGAEINESEVGPDPMDTTITLNPVSQIYCLESDPDLSEVSDGGNCPEQGSGPDAAIFCTPIIQGQSTLSDSAKCWIPQFYFDLGHKFNYRSENGDLLEMEIESKEHKVTYRPLLMEYDADSDSCIYNIHCYAVEIYNLVLGSENLTEKYLLEMRTELITGDQIGSDEDLLNEVFILGIQFPNGGTSLIDFRFPGIDQSSKALTDFTESVTNWRNNILVDFS